MIIDGKKIYPLSDLGRPTIKDYVFMFDSTKRLYSLLVLSTLFTGASFFFPYVVPLAFLCFFCLIDVIGFQHFSLIGSVPYGVQDTGYWDSSEHLPNSMKKLSRVILPAYRILQGTINIFLLLVIWLYFGFWFMIASEVLQWFGLQDLLYYWVVDEPLPKTWTWLHWTPFGLFDGDLSNGQVITQGVLGLIIAIGIMLIQHYKTK